MHVGVQTKLRKLEHHERGSDKFSRSRVLRSFLYDAKSCGILQSSLLELAISLFLSS